MNNNTKLSLSLFSCLSTARLFHCSPPLAAVHQRPFLPVFLAASSSSWALLWRRRKPGRGPSSGGAGGQMGAPKQCKIDAPTAAKWRLQAVLRAGTHWAPKRRSGAMCLANFQARPPASSWRAIQCNSSGIQLNPPDSGLWPLFWAWLSWSGRANSASLALTRDCLRAPSV